MMDNPANEHEEPAGEVAAAETRPGDMTSAQQFDLQANLTRIRECRLAGQYEEAQRYCRQILVHDPNNTEAYLLICALFIERGAYQEATSWYRKMTHLKGIENNSKYAAMIAKVFKDKQPGLVIEELIPPEPPRPEPVIPPPIEPAPMPAPERREPSLLPLIISPDPAQGTERVFRSEDRESNVMDSPVNEQNVPAGDMTAAKTELADMPPEPPFELLSILTRIRECRVAGRFEEAQDYCRQILADDPDNSEAHQLMWALCIEGGNYQEASSWYRKIDHSGDSADDDQHAAMIEEVFQRTLPGGMTEEPAPQVSTHRSIQPVQQEPEPLHAFTEPAFVSQPRKPVGFPPAEPAPVPSPYPARASRRPWWIVGIAILVLFFVLLAGWQVSARLSARYHADTHRSTPMGSPTATGQPVASKSHTTPPPAKGTMGSPPLARVATPPGSRTSEPVPSRLPMQGSAVPFSTEPAVHTGVVSVIQVPPQNPPSARPPVIRQANIQVSSTPAGADVFLDGRNTGRQTPCTLQIALGQTMTGSATVALEMTGYQRDERAVPVDAGKPAAVQFTLSRAPYQLAVNSTPGGGEIYVDGRDAGRQTPSTLTIDAGDHPTRDVTIAVELPGYARVERKLTLGNGNAPAIALTLGPPLGVPSTPAPVSAPAPGLPAGTRAGEVRTNPKDGAALVWVPAGEFLMGSASTDHLASDDETPQRRVMLAGYWIYRCEVTVAQFRAFTTAAGYTFDWTVRKPPWGWSDSQPMVNVTWRDARAYAAWAGGSLPTEAQWEKAARGTDGRLYPWGNAWSATACNTSEKGLNRPMPVGSYPAGASPYGAQDMAGNVGEWCADWYDHYSKATAPRNPIGPATGKWRILRGGSWRYTADGARCASRDYGSTAFYWLTAGFRCAIVP